MPPKGLHDALSYPVASFYGAEHIEVMSQLGCSSTAYQKKKHYSSGEVHRKIMLINV